MAAASEILEQEPIVVHTIPDLEMDDDRFFKFCQANRNLRIERSALGDLVIMAPSGDSSSHANIELAFFLQRWARQDRTGRAFDSSAGFKLPNGAIRSPDVAWVRKDRLAGFSQEQWQRFLPLCPDFVAELRSITDPLPVLKRKLEEYLQNGAELGWLLDPLNKVVHVYRPDRQPELLNDPLELSGESILKGFILPVQEIWRAAEGKD